MRQKTRHHLPGKAVPLLFAALILIVPVVGICSCAKVVKKIGVFTYGPDPDTDSAYKGLLVALGNRGYKKGENLVVVYRDGEKDSAKIEKIASEFASRKLDLVVPLTTPCLTAAVKHIKDKPIVFTSVYNPVAAGVASSPTNHPSNLTGVYSPPPVEKTCGLITRCVPGIKSVGTIYNPGEANSTSAVADMQSYCDRHGITLVRKEVGDPESVVDSASMLAGAGVKAFYITGDNTAMAAFNDIVGVANIFMIPVFINDPGFVRDGAVAGLGPNFESAGLSGGRMAACVLDGKDPAKMNLIANRNTLLYVNPNAAKTVGLELPADILKKADQIVGGSSGTK